MEELTDKSGNAFKGQFLLPLEMVDRKDLAFPKYQLIDRK